MREATYASGGIVPPSAPSRRAATVLLVCVIVCVCVCVRARARGLQRRQVSDYDLRRKTKQTRLLHTFTLS